MIIEPSGLVFGAAIMVAASNAAFAVNKVIKIGVLNDQSGLHADLADPNSLVAAQLAVEDSGLTKKDWKIEIVSGNHQNKPDLGVSIARQWIEVDKVDVISDVPTSSVALAVNNLTN
jgi:branched-chain amino acid transport system substrate-binding protein